MVPDAPLGEVALSLELLDPEVPELSLDPVPDSVPLCLLPFSLWWCFFLVVVVVVVDESSEPAPVPVAPLMLLPEPELEPMPEDEPELPVLVSDPVVPLIPPEPDAPVPVVLGVVAELPVEPEPVLLEPDPIELPDGDESELPAAPFDMMSMVWTLAVSPAPEKLARTWSPSFRSSMEARVPSFITCVLESTLSVLSLPDRVSVLFERSKLWTRPLTESKWPAACPVLPEGLVDALAPLLPDRSIVPGVLEAPVSLPVFELPLPMELPLPIDPERLPPIDPWLESWVEPLVPELLP